MPAPSAMRRFLAGDGLAVPCHSVTRGQNHGSIRQVRRRCPTVRGEQLTAAAGAGAVVGGGGGCVVGGTVVGGIVVGEMSWLSPVAESS